MSYNNNVPTGFGGLSRSTSRRHQRAGVDPEEIGSAQQRVDVDMDSQRSPPTGIFHTSGNMAHPDMEDRNQSSSSTPALQNASDSETEFDAHSLSGHMNVGVVRTEAYDSRTQASQASSRAPHLYSISLPNEDENMLLPESHRPRTQGTRRARVEDDVEGDLERDRRHPSQRTSLNSTLTPSPASGRSTGDPPTPPSPASGRSTGRNHPPFLPTYSSFITERHRRRQRHQQTPVSTTAHSGIDVQAESSSPSSRNSQVTNPPESGRQPTGATPNPADRFSQILESLFSAGGRHTIHTVADGAVAGEAPPAGNGGPGRLLGNLFAAMNATDGGAFSVNSETFTGDFPFFRFYPQEREDPERARILVEALDDVTIGLLCRLQRVSPESSGCAICWENLLEADGEYLKRGAEENKKTIEDGAKVDDIEPILKYGSQATGGSTESSLSSQSSQDSPLKTHIPKRPRIVTLPCTHVFHADCLIPWFTRPNQTTCPTCRFNIDPDNLTRGTGARRAAPSAGVGGESAAVTPGDDLTTRDSWMADPFSNGPGASDEYLFPGATASIGLFRVVGGADGGDTVVPILSTPIGSSTDSFPRGPSHQSASNVHSSTSLGEGSISMSTTDTHSDPSGSPVSSSVNDEVEIRDLPLNETASISSNIQREDLFYPNAPRLPMARDESIPPSAEPSNVTEEQLRSFVQTILGRLFNAEAIITASPSHRPDATPDAPGPPPASSTISPPSSGGSAPNVNRDPRAEHHREPVDGFVTIGFDFVIGPNPRPPEARQAHGSSAIGRERGFNTEHRPSLFERMALGTRPPAHSSNEFDATFNVDHSGPLRETGRSVETSNLFEPNASASINQADPPHSFSFLDPAIISATSRLRETTTGGHSRRPPPRVSNYISSMLGTTNSVPGTHPQRVNVPSERRQWIPPPPGLSLRQTIEKREREAGMRCWDVSCGVGPIDEDPFVTASGDQRRQVMIRRVAATAPQEGDLKGKGKGKPAERQYACDHSFHPSCLVSAQRASLNGFQEVIAEDGKYLEVSCTVCRTPGMLPKEDWEDGVRALEI